MKKLILILLAFLLMCFVASNAQAEYRDGDGVLGLTWAPPDTTGGSNPLSHYVIRYEYTQSGVLNSKIVETTNVKDSSVVLQIPGDWAIAYLRAVSTYGDTSVVIVSDSAHYVSSTGINPPLWIQGGWE